MTTTIVDPPGGPTPLAPNVLLTHGAGGDISSRGLAAWAEVLAAHGHLVVRANLPYRDAGRKAPPRAERSVEPFAAIAEEVRREHRGVWAVGGRSYGGRVASMAVAAGLVDAVAVLVAAYPLHPPGKPDRLRVAHWPDIAVPMLIVQGERDPFGSPAEVSAQLPALGAGGDVLAVDGADHALATRRGNEGEVADRLAPRVSSWLRAIVSGRS